MPTYRNEGKRTRTKSLPLKDVAYIRIGTFPGLYDIGLYVMFPWLLDSEKFNALTDAEASS